MPRHLFLRRLLRHSMLAAALLALSLLIGVVGYHFLEDMPWIDALLNASMILGGMGPVDGLKTDTGKIFASLYALFSGVIFLAIVATLIAPIAHRLLHRLHVEGK